MCLCVPLSVCVACGGRWRSPTHTNEPHHNTPKHRRLEDGFPLTAAQPANITEKSTCYSYVGVQPKRKARWIDIYMCMYVSVLCVDAPPLYTPPPYSSLTTHQTILLHQTPTQLFGRFRPPLRLGLLPYKMQGIPRTANIITQPDAEVFGLKYE